MAGKARKRTLYLQVDKKKVIMIELHRQDNHSLKTQKSTWSAEGHEFTKVFMKLQDVILARLLSGVTTATKGVQANQGTIKGKDFQAEYFFKKRNSKELLLTRSQKLIDLKKPKSGPNILNSPAECGLSNAKNCSGGGFASLTFLPEKLIVTVRQHSSDFDGAQLTSGQYSHKEPTKDPTDISKYFHTDAQVTKSARKKKQTLQSITRRMKDDGNSAPVEPMTSAESERAVRENEEALSSCSTANADARGSTTVATKSRGEIPAETNNRTNVSSTMTAQKRRRQDSDSDREERQSGKSNRSESKKSRKQEKLEGFGDRTRSQNNANGEHYEEVANCSDLQDFEEQKTNPAPKKRRLHNLNKLAYTRKTKVLKSKNTASASDGKQKQSSLNSARFENVLIEETDGLKPDKKTREGRADVLEGEHHENSEELHSSPVEPITIEDSKLDFNGVRRIEDLTIEHVEHSVWEMKRPLKDIFEGKVYCRRHEDYKRGGKSKGDLAFQVQFGMFSQDQHEAIMSVLTRMFCYKHSKYLDYITKVLLPETLIRIYLKIVGGSRDEGEHALFDNTKVPFR